MNDLTLVIGSRNTSSWSLRAWLAMVASGLPFEEVVIALHRPDTAERIRRWSPSGKVPALLVDGEAIWDSLAICEFLAEKVPSLWPADPLDRARARSVACEMHAGFAELRRFMPMDVTARFSPPGKLLRGVARDVQRIAWIWNDCRERYAERGPFLFGGFSIADIMHAPVVSRFVTYGVPLDPVSEEYVETMSSVPAMRAWAEAAALEVEAESERRAAATPATTAARPLSAVDGDAAARPHGSGIATRLLEERSPAPERPRPILRRPDAGIVSSPDERAPVPAAALETPADFPAPPARSASITRSAARPAEPPIKPIGDGTRRRR